MKQIQRRGTPKQQRLAKELIKNAKAKKPLNSGQLLENVGYSANLVKQPGRIIEQAGVKTELAILGFSEERAKQVVGEILEKKDAQDKDRLKAADMVFDVFGTKAPTKNLNVQVNLDNREEVEKALEKVLAEMKHNESNS